MDCSPPGSSVHGILQERILELVAMHFSRGSSQPRDKTHVYGVSCTGRILYHLSHQGSPTDKKQYIKSGNSTEKGIKNKEIKKNKEVS